jgi:large subunit ribosomal protein L35
MYKNEKLQTPSHFGMQALRRFRTTPLNFLRTNASVSTTQIHDEVVPPPPILEAAKPTPSQPSIGSMSISSGDAKATIQPTRGRNKRGRVIKRRPQISLANPRDWKRPIAYGVLPAYDEALRYLMRDSAVLKKEAEDLKAVISKEDEAPDRDENALKQKREKLNVLEVQSEVNLPEVRWKVANGMGVQ